MAVGENVPLSPEELKQATESKQAITPARGVSAGANAAQVTITKEQFDEITRSGLPIAPEVLRNLNIVSPPAPLPEAVADVAPIVTQKLIDSAREVGLPIAPDVRITESVEVGIETARPVTLDNADTLEQLSELQGGNPELFNILVAKGPGAFEKARLRLNLKEQREFQVKQFVVQQTLKRQARLEEILKPFKEKDGFNLGEAIKAGVPIATLKAVGFNKKQINEGKEFAAFLRASPVKRFELLKEQGLIPEQAVFKSIDKSGAINYTLTIEKGKAPIIRGPGEPLITARVPATTARVTAMFPMIEPVNLPKEVWQLLTPWNEKEGETVVTYLKQHFLIERKKPPTQVELKATFDAEDVQPLWKKILFGPTVIFDPRRKAYSELIIGYGPPIVPTLGPGRQAVEAIRAGNKVVRTLNASDVGMDAAQYTRFIRARVRQPGITPESFKLAERFAKDGIKLIDKTGKIDLALLNKTLRQAGRRPLQELTLTERRARAARRAAKGDTTQDIIDQTLAVWQKKRLATTVEARMAIPGSLTAATMALLLNRLADAPRGKVLDIIEGSDAVAALVSFNPQAMSAILIKEKISPAELTKLKTQAAIELKTADVTKQQSALVQQTLTEVATAVETETRTKTGTVTETLTQQQIETALQPATKRITQTDIEQAAKTETLQIPKQDIRKGKPRVDEPPARKPPSKPPADKTLPVKPPVKIPGNRGLSQSAVRKKISQAKGVIAWRQGQLNDKDRWDVIFAPYKTEDHFIVIGKKPANAQVVRGPGSAKKTAILVSGTQIEKTKVVDTPGPFRVKISPFGPKKVRLAHLRDSD